MFSDRHDVAAELVPDWSAGALTALETTSDEAAEANQHRDICFSDEDCHGPNRTADVACQSLAT